MIADINDIETFKSLPNDWFFPSELTYLDSPELRCKQFTEEGYLETKDNECSGTPRRLYRKVPVNGSDKNPFKEHNHLHNIVRLVSSAEERAKMVSKFGFFELANIVRDYVLVPVQKSVKKKAQQRLSEWPKDEAGDYIID